MKRSFTVWLTGLPCSGKTSIARELLKHVDAYHLDGDVLRKTLSKGLGFTREDRIENLRRASLMAKTLNEAGLNVVASFITPYESTRAEIKQTIEKSARFVLVYCKCSVETCIQRDNRGLYEKAKQGLIKDFTGVSAPYEEPKNADVIVDTERLSVSESANKILRYLYDHKILHRKASLFIGRFSPFHKGHKYIFDSVLNNGGSIVVAIRDSPDKYTVEQRKQMIETVYANNPNVKVIVIPDIQEVCVGRDVGYKIMAVPERISTISATNIRQHGKYEDLPDEIVDLVKKFDAQNDEIRS